MKGFLICLGAVVIVAVGGSVIIALRPAPPTTTEGAGELVSIAVTAPSFWNSRVSVVTTTTHVLTVTYTASGRRGAKCQIVRQGAWVWLEIEGSSRKRTILGGY